MTQQPEHDGMVKQQSSASTSSSASSESPLSVLGSVVALASPFIAAALGKPALGRLVAFALLAVGCLFGVYFIVRREKKVVDALLLVSVPLVCAGFFWATRESATPEVPNADLKSSISQKVGRPTGTQASELFSLGVRTVELSVAGEGDFPDLVGDRRYGIEVESVDEGGVGFRAGVRVRDVVQKANGREIKTRVDLDSTVKEFCPNSGPVTLGVWRNGRSVNLDPICSSP